MVRGHRNMLQQLQYNFILIICAFDGVVINTNEIMFEQINKNCCILEP